MAAVKIEDRKQYVIALLNLWRQWVKSDRGVKAYPRETLLHKVITFGPECVASMYGYKPDANQYEVEQVVDQAVCALQIANYRCWECIQAKYLGKVRRMQLLEEHPDFKLQEYLRITKHVYYRSLNAAYQFIDGYVESKNLELQLFSGKQASGG